MHWTDSGRVALSDDRERAAFRSALAADPRQSARCPAIRDASPDCISESMRRPLVVHRDQPLLDVQRGWILRGLLAGRCPRRQRDPRDRPREQPAVSAHRARDRAFAAIRHGAAAELVRAQRVAGVAPLGATDGGNCRRDAGERPPRSRDTISGSTSLALSIPHSRNRSMRAAHSAASAPPPIPARRVTSVSRPTSRRISARCAPSAMRTPNSRMRAETAIAVIP